MDRKQKMQYLKQYEQLKNRFEYLNSRINEPNTVHYDRIKSTTHKSLTDRIAERDNAYIDMMCKKSEFGLLIDDLLLFHKYVLLWSDNKIADEFGMNMKKYKREFNKALDNLVI
ncbi:hypothetical protein [Thomasclavelia cocleata]|uniref:hypothetical protein n=1 Tax=Thomasclavelia cocleata TaxID=69824 RepID=UPI00242F8CF3|nr:hypothetical protein [Thomasclavelia cocleata]